MMISKKQQKVESISPSELRCEALASAPNAERTITSSVIFSRVKSPAIRPASNTGSVLHPSRRFFRPCVRENPSLQRQDNHEKRAPNRFFSPLVGEPFNDVLAAQNAFHMASAIAGKSCCEPARSSEIAVCSVSRGARVRNRVILASFTCKPSIREVVSTSSASACAPT
jgi:hypothetical protein